YAFVVFLFFFFLVRFPPSFLLFPYTTLFRSGADIAFDADPKFFACLVRFESSSVPTTLPTAYDVYPLDGRHDGGYYTEEDSKRTDRKSGSAGMPRPISYAVFCLKKKKSATSP